MSKNDHTLSIGEQLIEMRLAKGYSQRKLAQLSGLTNTAISGIEQGRNSPSINTLDSILQVMGSDLASFFTAYKEEQKREIKTVIKADELINIGRKNQGGGVQLNLVHNGNPTRQLSMLIEVYPPHSQTEEKITHEGEESGTVISGKVTIILGEERYELEAGDSYVFDTSTPHTFINETDETAKIVSAHTPTTF